MLGVNILSFSASYLMKMDSFVQMDLFGNRFNLILNLELRVFTNAYYQNKKLRQRNAIIE